MKLARQLSSCFSPLLLLSLLLIRCFGTEAELPFENPTTPTNNKGRLLRNRFTTKGFNIKKKVFFIYT